MDLTDFIKAETADFRAKHPSAEGWSVHLNFLSFQMFMPLMPAFLRASLPKDAYEENIATQLSIAPNSMRITDLPRFPRRKGIYEDDWTGEIHLTWHGSDLHFRRFWVSTGMDSSGLTLIATKNMTALEDFWKAGLKFASRRGFKKEIMVINGPDLKRPKARWDDVILPDGMKRQIRENFEAFLKAKAAYKTLGLPYRRGFLFMGPPGNGKSLVGKVIASEYRVNMVTLHLKSNLEESSVDYAFSRAAGNPPCVLLLEDLDKMIHNTRVSLSYLLNLMDGLGTKEGIIVIATTNNPEQLDPALLHRPSRFDRVWEFKLPGFEERLALLRLRNKTGFSDAAIERAAQASAGFSMAYVQEAMVSAQLAALHAGVTPTDEHLDTSVAQLKTQIKDASHGCKPIGSPVAIGFNGKQQG